MESKDLILQSHYFGLNGFSLTIEEKTALQSSLIVLQDNNHFHTVVYWGKIMGIKGDYHIAQGYKGSMVGERISFYSVDGGITWNQIAISLTPYELACIKSMRSMFVGIPSYAYIFDKPKEEENEEKIEKVKQNNKVTIAEEDDEENDEDKKEEEENHEDDKPKKEEIFTIVEEKRLSWTITEIDRETSVVPRGAYLVKLDEEKIIVKNTTFFGLDKHAASKIYNYIHLRQPENLKEIMSGQTLNKAFDFADSIDKDIPKGCWSLQFEDIYNMVVGRSLLWPGYVFYHQIGSNVFGGYYIGSGMKNLDLCFMLH
ncbi:hypothetical protein ABK040_001882 [Willaertia magna]